MSSPWAMSSLVTESTRKGMSSVTIWTRVRGSPHDSFPRVGLVTSTLAVPGIRVGPT